jgi:hypothetical protein
MIARTVSNLIFDSARLLTMMALWTLAYWRIFSVSSSLSSEPSGGIDCGLEPPEEEEGVLGGWAGVGSGSTRQGSTADMKMSSKVMSMPSSSWNLGPFFKYFFERSMDAKTTYDCGELETRLVHSHLERVPRHHQHTGSRPGGLHSLDHLQVDLPVKALGKVQPLPYPILRSLQRVSAKLEDG